MQIARCLMWQSGKVALWQNHLCSLIQHYESKEYIAHNVDSISHPSEVSQVVLWWRVFHLYGLSKFIVHPNYKVKVSREVVKLVNFITATRRTDKYEFNGKRYVKIESDPATEW